MRLLLVILLLYPIFSYADTIHCKVVDISDGNTITCLTSKSEKLSIKLYQIEAPEEKQDSAILSKQTLSNLIFNRTVEIETHGNDNYKRTLGTIYFYQKLSCDDHPEYGICAERKNINLEMIKLGMAWYYPFAQNNDDYKQAEEKARVNKIGIWSQKAIAPWEFRKSKEISEI